MWKLFSVFVLSFFIFITTKAATTPSCPNDGAVFFDTEAACHETMAKCPKSTNESGAINHACGFKDDEGNVLWHPEKADITTYTCTKLKNGKWSLYVSKRETVGYKQTKYTRSPGPAKCWGGCIAAPYEASSSAKHYIMCQKTQTDFARALAAITSGLLGGSYSYKCEIGSEAYLREDPPKIKIWGSASGTAYMGSGVSEDVVQGVFLDGSTSCSSINNPSRRMSGSVLGDALEWRKGPSASPTASPTP